MSGAPLCLLDHEPTIEGIVIGNRSTEMVVFSSRERVADDKETIVERFEAMQVGVAIQARALLELESALLGKTLGAHLAEQGLL